MLKNIINYIFIYILSFIFIGCENNIFGHSEPECTYCELELSTELEVDKNGYHHLFYVQGSVQTYTQIEAYVGHGDEYVGWITDTQYCYEWNGTNQCWNLINGSSYSGSDHIAKTILGVHEQNIGDTIKVYCGYYWDYGSQYLDSLEIIVNE